MSSSRAVRSRRLPRERAGDQARARRRERDARRRRARRRRAPARRRGAYPRRGGRTGQRPALGVCRLPQLTPCLGGPPSRRDGRGAACRGHSRARRRLRGRTGDRGRGRARPGADRRADRLDPSRGALGLAPPPQRPRGAQAARRRPAVHTRRLGRRRAHRRGQCPRRRQRDRARGAAPPTDPPARGGGARSLPDPVPAVRSEPGRAPRGRAPPARCARHAARRGPRGARPGGAPRPVHRSDAGDRGRARRRGDRLDVPGRALRLAAPRRRGAPAKDAGVPIEHVVADLPSGAPLEGAAR